MVLTATFMTYLIFITVNLLLKCFMWLSVKLKTCCVGFSVSEWKKQRRLVHLGMSPYIAAGSHIYKGEKYRFLVLQRFGVDLNKLFLKYGKKFHLKTVLNLGIQIVSITSCYFN